MIVILGLLLLIAAVVAAVAGVLTNSGSAHPLGDPFTIFGQHLPDMSTGQLFLYGIVVGAAGMLGLSMLLGAFSRRTATRGSQRALRGSQRETTAVIEDRDRLTRELDDERAERRRVETGQAQPINDTTTPLDDATEPASAPVEPPRLRERISHRADR